jgi:hypothetical protein
MSSLKYLSKDNLRIGNPHSIYRTVKPSILDVRKCIIKTLVSKFFSKVGAVQYKLGN